MSSKQREALLAVYDCAKDGVLTIRESAFEKVMEALAEPLLNCEVGTAAEQYERLESFCAKHFRYANDNPCSKCPIYKDDSLPCVYRFLQMPYEEGGKK